MFNEPEIKIFPLLTKIKKKSNLFFVIIVITPRVRNSDIVTVVEKL